MSFFQPATNDSAYLKAQLFGFAGSGKTYSATSVAIGLHRLLKERGLPEGKAPVFFLDTETGSDWMRQRFAEAGIQVHTAKTRAFKDLIPATIEAERAKAIMVVDSISHFWRELCETYSKEKRRTRLHFEDWALLKMKWGEYTDCLVNSAVHVISCGRAKFEYDYFENDAGKKELEKTGVGMKAEGETAYESSLLILMTRDQQFDSGHPERSNTAHFGTVLKDRSTLLDGKVFKNPKFEDFLPHIECLNLGGKQKGVDTSRTSASLVPPDSGEGKLRRERHAIALDEIQSILVKHHPGQNKEDKAAKMGLLEAVFNTPSWERVGTLSLEQLEHGRNELWIKLEGKPYSMARPGDDGHEMIDVETAKTLESLAAAVGWEGATLVAFLKKNTNKGDIGELNKGEADWFMGQIAERKGQ